MPYLFRRSGLAAAFLAIALAGAAMQPARAIPLWASAYGVSCQKCHTVAPHLTTFGAHFAAAGYRIPGVTPGPVFPLAMKLNLVAANRNQGSGPDGQGLPKAIVDEVELLTAGTAGSRGSYFIEQYAVDGGEPGLLREGWLQYRAVPWSARIPLSVRAGLMTLPLPVDPETFRESYLHYSVFDETAGQNPFNFFDPKIGTRVSVGDEVRGASVQLFAGPGYDRQSGLSAAGTDLMAFAQDAVGPLTGAIYRYTGERPVSSGAFDRFERTGYGLVFLGGKWEGQSVLQTGWDSNCGAGAGCASSGGFTQLRYTVSPRFFALARYEGTNSSPSGFSRDAVLLAGFRPAHNSRLTLEDDISGDPAARSTTVLQFTVGY